MIAIPESVAFYWNDPVNRAAVNVLAGGLEVPGDLTLAEAERFERANLAARRVRVEHWVLLRALWSASWERAVQTHFPNARLLTYGEQVGFTTEIEPLADPSVDNAWQHKAVAGVFDLGRHGRLFTRVGLTRGEREAALQVYLIAADRSCAITDDLDLGPDWTDDGDNRRTTTAGLLPIAKGDGRIDPEPFASLSLAAATALAAALA